MTIPTSEKIQEPQHNFFLLIPSFITDDPDIDDSTAILYGRLVALSNQKGYCWASDDYLAKLTRVCEREVRKRLKTLEDKGYIIRKTKKNGFGWDRRIYPQFQNCRTKGTPDPFDTDEVDRSIRSPQSEEQDKLNNINNNNNKSGGCFSVEEKEKRDLFTDTPISQDVIDRSIAYSIKEIQQALECLKYGKYTDCNAFFWSALSLGWLPSYPKEDKQAQEANKQASERDSIKNTIHELYEKYHTKMKDGYELRKSLDGNVLFKDNIKNTMFPIEFTEKGLRDFHFLIDNYTK